jgi:hypothetical protein
MSIDADPPTHTHTLTLTLTHTPTHTHAFVRPFFVHYNHAHHIGSITLNTRCPAEMWRGTTGCKRQRRNREETVGKVDGVVGERGKRGGGWGEGEGVGWTQECGSRCRDARKQQTLVQTMSRSDSDPSSSCGLPQHTESIKQGEPSRSRGRDPERIVRVCKSVQDKRQNRSLER